MNKRLSAAFAIAIAFAASASAQAPSKTRGYVETLASPRFEGRLAGSNGETLASDYIASELEKIGAMPLPGRTDVRLPFEFTAGTRDGGSTIRLSAGAACVKGVAGSSVGPIGEVR